MLIPIYQVLDKNEVQHFRAQLAQGSWHDGALTAGSLGRAIKSNQQLDENCEIAVALGNHIVRKLGNHPLFVSAALPQRIYPPRFNCYRDGGNYGAHVDAAIMQVPGTGISVRSDISATLFLCEPEEYAGGELEIESAFGMQQVKLNAGDMVLYPPSSLHRVTPVTEGARTCAFFWIQSMVADDGARTLLFDLDQSIQRLTPTVGAENPELLSLAGVYHNLLRRWAST